MTTLLTILSLAALPIQENATDVQSKIAEATVYQYGALVTRTATVQLQPGLNSLVFSDLTATMNPNTIQLGGDGSYTILSLTHDFNYLEQIVESEEVKLLKARIVELEELLKRNKASIQVERKREAFLDPSTLINKEEKYTTAELQTFLEFYSLQSANIQNRILDLEIEAKAHNDELHDVRKQLRELDQSYAKNTSEITVELESNRSQTVEFQITYLINNSGWQPTYDIRVDDTNKPVELVYKAAIYQNSGYDWDDITLSVSSANPMENATKPELSPWYIDFYEAYLLEQRARKSSAPASEADAVMGAADEAIAEETLFRREAIASFKQNTTSFTYRIDRPYSIPNGKGEFMAVVSKNDINADFSYAAVPKQSQNAFLVAELSEWGDLNLLSGQANLYFENTYIGQTYISPASVQDTLNISLGTDKGIVIDRKSIKDFEERNFFGNKTRETRTFEISIRNTKDRDIKISIEDQIPVSMDEGIKVSPKDLSDADYQKETGFLTWDLNVKAGETRSFRFSYQVEYPKGRQINF